MKYINYKGYAKGLNTNSCSSSRRAGFTLVEVLTTVLIVGILVTVALPMYTRTIERSRATEAMSAIKSINDAIYAFFVESEECPYSFNQLVAALPDASAGESEETVTTKFFRFDLNIDGVPPVPGTDNCPGVLATRTNGGKYNYNIWHPYTRGTTGTSLSLQCAPVEQDDATSQAICESLGLYREGSTGFVVGEEEELEPASETALEENEAIEYKPIAVEKETEEAIAFPIEEIGKESKTDVISIEEKIKSIPTEEAPAP